MRIFIICITTLLSIYFKSYGQPNKPVVNYLGIAGPISVQKNSYQLSWSSHPNATFFKQEYLVAGDAFPNYKSMLTIDFIKTTSTADQAVAAKIREWDQLKRSGYDVNFTMVENTASDEKMIDCLIKKTAVKEEDALVERDVYRFKPVVAKSGQRGLLLFALSNRKYGKEVNSFLIKLKSDRQKLISEVLKFPIPELNIPLQY